LGYAIERFNLPLIRQLLDLGADPNNQVGVFGSVLRYSVFKGLDAITPLLIEKGADLNVSTMDCRSPLAAAIDQRNEPLIRQMLDWGADVNIDDGYPLLMACQEGNMKLVNLLIDAGAELQVQQGIPGNALRRAAMWGHLEVCKLLISRGVDVNAHGGQYG